MHAMPAATRWRELAILGGVLDQKRGGGVIVLPSWSQRWRRHLLWRDVQGTYNCV